YACSSYIRRRMKSVSWFRGRGPSAAWIVAAIAIPGAALADEPAKKAAPVAVPPAPAAKKPPTGDPVKGAPAGVAPPPSPSTPKPDGKGIIIAPRNKVSARWTAATPDEMVDLAFARVRRGGEDALAALVVASSLDDRASFGKVRDGLKAIAASG